MNRDGNEYSASLNDQCGALVESGKMTFKELLCWIEQWATVYRRAALLASDGRYADYDSHGLDDDEQGECDAALERGRTNRVSA